jgi:2-keto-3-deoxy-6-phosphogluconate aldolase
VSNPSEAAKKVRDSVVIIKDVVAHNRVLVLKNLDKMLVDDGLHTIEVVHETPFGKDLLFQSTLQVERKIVVNSSLFTQ